MDPLHKKMLLAIWLLTINLKYFYFDAKFFKVKLPWQFYANKNFFLLCIWRVLSFFLFSSFLSFFSSFLSFFFLSFFFLPFFLFSSFFLPFSFFFLFLFSSFFFFLPFSFFFFLFFFFLFSFFFFLFLFPFFFLSFFFLFSFFFFSSLSFFLSLVFFLPFECFFPYSLMCSFSLSPSPSGMFSSTHFFLCGGRESSGLIAKVSKSDLQVREFKLLSHSYIHFWTNILGKGMNPLIPPPPKKIWVK